MPMATTVGTFMLQRLVDWGVRRVYGYPGDGINGILGGFHEVEDIEFTQVRHEEIASLAACAHAKFTGEVGVCLATSGPGAIHLLNGLYDAKLDHQPVVAIVGQQARMSLGSEYQQEVDLDALFKDVAGQFVQTCVVPQQAPHLIDRAMRIAKATRSPTCVIVPNDVQEAAYEEPPRKHGAVHSSDAELSAERLVPSEDALRAAADVLNAGDRVAILIGQGAKRAPDEVRAVADALGAGVAKALNGRAALPDDLPYVTGAIGLLGTKPSSDMMESCDTLLLVGTNFPYSEWLPEPGQARAVQIDRCRRCHRTSASSMPRGWRSRCSRESRRGARSLPSRSRTSSPSSRRGETGRACAMLGFGENQVSIYLNDHLAGANAGVELARRVAPGEVAQEIEEDRAVLLEVMQRLSVGRDPVRVALGWGTEKMLRLKPGGRFEDLEALSLGVEGKLALWTALQQALGDDPRLRGIEFEPLMARARSQRRRIEQQRLDAVAEALA
jgi:hypothetical protein